MVDPVVAKRMAEEDMLRRNAEAKGQVGCHTGHSRDCGLGWDGLCSSWDGGWIEGVGHVRWQRLVPHTVPSEVGTTSPHGGTRCECAEAARG